MLKYLMYKHEDRVNRIDGLLVTAAGTGELSSCFIISRSVVAIQTIITELARDILEILSVDIFCDVPL